MVCPNTFFCLVRRNTETQRFLLSNNQSIIKNDVSQVQLPYLQELNKKVLSASVFYITILIPPLLLILEIDALHAVAHAGENFVRDGLQRVAQYRYG